MALARTVTAIIPAGIITGSLVLAMHLLIASNMKEPAEGDEYKIPEITMPDREISTEYDTKKPDKPDEPDEPPPELPEPEFESEDISLDLKVNTNFGAKLEIAGVGGFSGDGDYLPIVKVQAKYPSRALNKGLEGYCTVAYTVTTSGDTKDHRVTDCSHRWFEAPSIKAAKKFKYKPKVIDGEPIEVPDVRNRFTFQMAK